MIASCSVGISPVRKAGSPISRSPWLPPRRGVRKGERLALSRQGKPDFAEGSVREGSFFLHIQPSALLLHTLQSFADALAQPVNRAQSPAEPETDFHGGVTLQ